MEEVSLNRWNDLLMPHGAATNNSTNQLRRSSSWRRSGHQGHHEGPGGQVNKPARAERPRSCIEGGQVDKWLQTLQRLQSRPHQKQIPAFVDRTVSMPALPNDVTGSNHSHPQPSPLRRGKQTPSVCPSLCESSLDSVESLDSRSGLERRGRACVKPGPSTEKAKFCSLAPVSFGWLPVQRRVILTDVSNNVCGHDSSRCQQKLKSPITPVLLNTPGKLNRSGSNESESGKSLRPESVGFRYWRTAEKISPNFHQASASVSSEGGPNGSRAWNPTANLTSKADTSQSRHAGIRPNEPPMKDPVFRRGSVPETGPVRAPSSGSADCSPKHSSTISSITITSRKVTRTSSLPDTSRLGQRSPSPMKMHNHASTDPLSTPATTRQKAIVIKVTEQRLNFTTTTGPNAAGRPVTPNHTCDQIQDRAENNNHVVLRRKASIIKMTEQREHFIRERPDRTKTAAYRHSYTEGLNRTDSLKYNQNSPSAKLTPLNQALTVSLQPGGNQWRSSEVQHRSSVSLYVKSPENSPQPVDDTNTKKYKPPNRRPLSCDFSLFNHTELWSNPAKDPEFHNTSSPVAQKTNIDLVSSSSSEAGRRSAFSGEAGSLDGVKEQSTRDRTIQERVGPVSGIKPPTLLRIPDDSTHSTADAILALNAAAVIANIKLQAQRQRVQNHSTSPEPRQNTSRATTTEDKGRNGNREQSNEDCLSSSGPDGKNESRLLGPHVEFVPLGSKDLSPESTPVSLSLSEALSIRRPDFIQRSQARVRALEWRSQERHALQKPLTSPQRPDPACVQQQGGLLKSKGRSITGKGLQKQSRRNYNQLPEVRKRREEEKRKKEEEKRKLASQTNRLRAELFKKKLLDQVLQRGNH